MTEEELYIATLTLDQREIDQAISPEQRRYSMAQDVATHGAQIASLFMSARRFNELLESEGVKIMALARQIGELQHHVRVLMRCVIVLAAVAVLLAWTR